MNVHEIVTKLIGPIMPVSESHIDDQRFENLKTMTDLIDRLLGDVDDVARLCANRYEFNMQRAGQYAATFKDRLGIE